jgi:hypothetical protein
VSESIGEIAQLISEPHNTDIKLADLIEDDSANDPLPYRPK